MSYGTDVNDCPRKCWIAAIVIGVLFWLLLMIGWDWRFLTALLLGIIVAVVLGFVLRMFVCDESGSGQGASGGSGSGDNRSTAQKAADATSSAAGAAAAKASGAAQATATKVDETAEAAGEKTQAAKETAAEKAADAKEAVADKAEEAKEAVTSDDATGAASGSATASGAADKSASASGTGDSPQLFDAPQHGKADDLKKISGVGPKLEQTLNDMGIWHFHQVASWGPDDVAWVDSRLKFKGRIERDNWIAQAKAFSEGQEL